eukprot:TRINITY_DN2117_c0_g1_i5.p1 TRINITY_DN2117_c0_g1~~TRINITY_DN2117_c0_g1_i5.p1  ORF type:complete len:395 (+),score=74.32 TRINITY_DN2117_c0_g1_i5:222-1406(+)
MSSRFLESYHFSYGLLLALLAAFAWAEHTILVGDEPLEFFGQEQSFDELERPVAAHIRDEIMRQTNETIARLGLKTKRATTYLSHMPLVINSAVSFTDYYMFLITNYVDRNSATPNQIRDYKCGTRSYDLSSGYNHQGIDMAIWPFYWKRTANNNSKVVAAAAGTIVSKDDGHFDRECAMNNNAPNYVAVRHGDGNVAYYYHLKSGTVTTKSVGSTVAAGELLGYPGSSGSSTGPHLHFELQNSVGQVLDPYASDCNAGGVPSEGYWAASAQAQGYRPGYILAMRIRTTPPDAPYQCYALEDDSDVTSFGYSNQNFYFVVYIAQAEATDTLTLTIRRPNGSIRNQVTLNFGQYYAASWWYWNWSFDTSSDPRGTYSVSFALATGNNWTKNFVRN